ncbi:hypothetical protein NG895_26625 [Aeoliella sp. ICT_H6.2]|uniref:Uncharacterized protein n=1 Tax=Aeoliella straminimaris TaxID=2954799 RepID=A0A9X2FI49_9BACT|nr:hypothetical protein [Aeoliella straminimaris]MCO6047494.1 hypothetical protein [Aeoliella straminimaris]
MRTANIDQAMALEDRLHQIRRQWSPEVYRRRRRSAEALQKVLTRMVLRPISQSRPVPQAG